MAPGTWRHMGDSLPVTSPEIMRKTYISIKNIYLFHMESVLLKPCHEPERSKGILKRILSLCQQGMEIKPEPDSL